MGDTKKQSQPILAPAAALILLAVVGCGGGGGLSPTTPNASVAQIEHGSFQLVNAEREVNEVLPRLGGDPQLEMLAREHSELMRDEGFFAHTQPSGKTLQQRLASAGFSFTLVGENLARVTNAGDPAGYAHTVLMQNAGHRANILNGKYGRLGVGVATEGKTVWITQIYVDP